MHGHVCYKKVNFATKISALTDLLNPLYIYFYLLTILQIKSTI